MSPKGVDLVIFETSIDKVCRKMWGFGVVVACCVRHKKDKSISNYWKVFFEDLMLEWEGSFSRECGLLQKSTPILCTPLSLPRLDTKFDGVGWFMHGFWGSGC